MRSGRQPSVALSTVIVAATTVIVGYTRLFMFRSAIVPLALVLPLLLCVWTRQSWQLWGMTIAYAVMSAARAFWILPTARVFSQTEAWAYLGNNVINLTVGALAVQAILAYRNRVDENTAVISARNSEIGSQSAVLARQNQQIEAQTRALERQNSDLRGSNDRLRSREDILEMLLQSSRAQEIGSETLVAVCHRGLRIVGIPAAEIGIYELELGNLVRRAHAADSGGPRLPPALDAGSPIGRLVLREGRTATLAEIKAGPGGDAPFPADRPIASLLASPLRLGGFPGGAIIACGTLPDAWSAEQVRLIEWLAAQCSQIFEVTRRQKELADRTREIEAANSAKDNFIAMLSHELRTPLTPVMATVSSLERDERLPDDVRADIDMILRNVKIQSRLIDDLLDLTRITRGKLELVEQKPLDISLVLKDAASVVAADLEAKRQTLEMRIEPLKGCLVKGDSARLQQVFWNLLKNASKFSPAEARIELVAEMSLLEPRSAVIDIVDHGIGIEAKDLERIFLPFEQVISMGKQRGSGSGHGMGLGLGLGIARAIMELHGGSIRVRSEGANRGSQFTVELPVATCPDPTPADRGARPADAPAQPEITPLRILLVEDHADTSRAMARLLRQAGHTVETAANVAQATAAFERRPYDLIVSDLGLPDESGLVLMRRLREMHSGVAGICLSGYGTDDDLRACQEAGFSEHLTKPVDVGRLHAAVARARSTLEHAKGG
jgi:signal transduction histidine kinase/ActR/RegA family two-component response regulator